MDTPSTPAVENLKQDSQVKSALKEVQPPEQPAPHKSRVRARAWTFALILSVLSLGWVTSRFLGEWGTAKPWVEKSLLAAAAAVAFIALEQGLEVYLLRRLHDSAARFNLKRVLRL